MSVALNGVAHLDKLLSVARHRCTSRRSGIVKEAKKK